MNSTSFFFFFQLMRALFISEMKYKAQSNQKNLWMMVNTLLGTEDEASICLSQHCKNHFSRMREASTVLINWVCRVLGGLLFLKHTHKTQDRGNHIITHMSLWFGKTSGWLPAAARNDGESDRARLSHTPYAFWQHIFPPLFFFFLNAVSMLSKSARKTNYIGVPSLSYQILLFQPTK